MLKPLLLAPAILLLTLLPAAPGQKPSHKPAKAAAEPETIQVQPARPAIKQIYSFDCAICHGATGSGKTDLATSMQLTMPDWTNPATLTGMTDQQLYDVIRKGKDKMPPEDASRAKDDEVRELVKYIRSFASAAPATTPAPAAEPTSAPAPAPSPTPATAPKSPSAN